jgi:hypothetical protein
MSLIILIVKLETMIFFHVNVNYGMIVELYQLVGCFLATILLCFY